MFERLIPILNVGDLEAERDFYVGLGFEVTYEGREYPDFIALGAGTIEFGLERRNEFDQDAPDRVLKWQFQVADLDDAAALLTERNVTFEEEWFTPREDWKYRVLHFRSPNGYHMQLEGSNEG